MIKIVRIDQLQSNMRIFDCEWPILTATISHYQIRIEIKTEI